MINNKRTLAAYISIARPAHWTKHIFILPGWVLAATLVGIHARPASLLSSFAIGMLSACLISSANYTINEWLDAKTDAFHPEKKDRAGVQGLLTAKGVYLQYMTLLVLGLCFAAAVNKLFFFTSAAFAVSGVLYNVSPMRTKDKLYLDVLSEAINNPIRLLLGWSMVTGEFVPPLSFGLSYYFGGAFLMTAKRLSEYRFILATKGKESAGLYRRSFKFYTEQSLIGLCCFYMNISCVLLGVFLYKYRVEYILLMPLVAVLFAYYLKNATQFDSLAQKPEKLFKSKTLLLIVGTLIVSFIVLSLCDLTSLSHFLTNSFNSFRIY